jgi:hypothetical protein
MAEELARPLMSLRVPHTKDSRFWQLPAQRRDDAEVIAALQAIVTDEQR